MFIKHLIDRKQLFNLNLLAGWLFLCQWSKYSCFEAANEGKIAVLKLSWSQNIIFFLYFKDCGLWIFRNQKKSVWWTSFWVLYCTGVQYTRVLFTHCTCPNVKKFHYHESIFSLLSTFQYTVVSFGVRDLPAKFGWEITTLYCLENVTSAGLFLNFDCQKTEYCIWRY